MIRNSRMCRRSASAATLRDERGAALVIVLTIVALLTITVIEFTYNVQLDQHRARNALNSLQSQLLARSGVNIAEAYLARDYETKFDAFTEEWALNLAEFCNGMELEPGVLIKCDVEDESGKLNVNLTRPTTQGTAPPANQNDTKRTKDSVLRDALEVLAVQYDIQIEELGDQVREYWESVQPTPAPGQGNNNTRAPIPYFTSVEDFARTFRIPTSKLKRLRRVLTAQPPNRLSSINANTASADVLRAIIVGYYGDGEDIVQRIMDRRAVQDGQAAGEPFQDKSQLTEALADLDDSDGRRGAVGQLLGVTSNLFRLQASAVTNADPNGATVGGIGQTLSVLVRRSQKTATRNNNGGQDINWTFRRLDWQKEPGARLFRAAPEDQDEETDEEDGDMEEESDSLRDR